MPALTKLLSTAALLAATLPSTANAHTWIEEMQVIDSNGSYTGASGFSRGYMARTDPGFNGDSNLWLLPSLEARNPDQTVRDHLNGSDLLCHPSQRSSNYTNTAYPMLKATPGSFVAMKYLENGHVTLPWTLTGKPANGGTVLIYGTTQPEAEEKIVDVMKWNEDGTGGDKRGFLMGSMDYDDGECHQLNTCWVSGERQILFPNNIPGQGSAQTERWCESDVKIPEKVTPGKLTVYWIWDWSTTAGEDCLAPEGKAQYYTNCADVEIVANLPAAGNVKVAASASPVLDQQDPNTRAVKNFASRTAANKFAMTTAANWADFNNKVAATPSSAQNSSWLSFCQTSILAQQSAAAANPQSLPPLCPPNSYAPTGAAFSSWSASVKARGVMETPAGNQAASTAAPSAPAATSAPAVSSAPAAPSAPAASSAPAPAASSASIAADGVVTITSTQVSVSTLTTYVATSPAASAPAPSAPAPSAPTPSAAAPSAPAASAPAPPADGANASGFPTISVISNASAGMPAPTGAAAPGGAPYAVHAGSNGMGGEHAPPPRRHARQFA